MRKEGVGCGGRGETERDKYNRKGGGKERRWILQVVSKACPLL